MRIRNTLLALSALGIVSVLAMANGRVDRAQTFAIERQFTDRALALWGDDRYMFFKLPEAYSVDHFGILMTADVNLAPGPALMAFRGPITKQEIVDHKHTVLQRMPKFRQFLKSELIDAAAMFPGEPETGRISIAVTIYHFSWEDTGDIPTQIVVQGVKKDLLEAKAHPALAERAVEMEETE